MWHRMGSYTPAMAKWMHEGRHLVFLAGDNVKSTVPVLVAGIMPVGGCCRNHFSKGFAQSHTHRETTGPPACPRPDAMALLVKVVPLSA